MWTFIILIVISTVVQIILPHISLSLEQSRELHTCFLLGNLLMIWMWVKFKEPTSRLHAETRFFAFAALMLTFYLILVGLDSFGDPLYCNCILCYNRQLKFYFEMLITLISIIALIIKPKDLNKYGAPYGIVSYKYSLFIVFNVFSTCCVVFSYDSYNPGLELNTELNMLFSLVICLATLCGALFFAWLFSYDNRLLAALKKVILRIRITTLTRVFFILLICIYFLSLKIIVYVILRVFLFKNPL
jgi:hypothetical protein